MAIKTLRVFQEFTSSGYVPMPVAGNIDYGVTIAGTFPGTTPTTFQTDDPDIDVTLTATTDYYVWIRSHGTDWNPMYTRNVRVYPDSPLVNNVVMGIIIANLDNTVPYVGATENVNLGEFGLTTGYLGLDLTPTNTPTLAGTMSWNDADGTANLILKGGNVTLQVGQEQVTRIVNKTGANLLEANYQAVRVSGAQGNRLKVALAQADVDANSAETLGLVTETINNNQEGFITTSGLVRNIDTTGTLQGETWADGDMLYLSGTTAGRVTNIKPQAPTHTVIMGYVVRAHQTQGAIYVKVDNGYELDELHNVKITSVANKNTLVYDSATSVWKNRNIFGTQGYVPYYDDTLLMKNSPIFTDGTQVIIGDDEEFSVGNKLSVVGNIAVHKDYGYHSGLYQILFRQDATGEFRIGTNAANDYTTFYANGTERVRISPSGFLGVGLTNPTSILHVKGTTAYTNAIIDNNSASGGGYYSAYQNGAEKAIFGVSGAWLLNNTSDAALIAKGVGQGIQFYTNGSTSEKMGINSDGNVFVGQTPTYVAGATQLVVRGKTGAGFIGVNHYDMSIKGFMNTFNYVFQVGTSTFHSMAFLVEDIERGRVNSSGRLLWGTTADNTTDLVQINGSLIATSLKKVGGTSSQFLKADGSVDSTTYGIGSVTNVGLSAPTGFSVSGSPITTSGTLALSFASGYSLPSDATQATWTAKQNALNGTGFVKISGTTISYDNSTYYLASNPSGYISGITSLMVTNALGYTPYNSTNPAGYTTNVGTVTSVSMSVPTGLSISGSPITTSGTLALSLSAGYSIPTTSSQGTWDTAYNRSLTSIGVSGTTTKTLTLTKQDGTTLSASWSDINTDAVTSVFGRTGSIVATSGDYTTAQVTESGNLYYLDSRARASISGGTGISYNSTTGVITNTITQYTDALARASISGGTGISYNLTSGVITNTITQYTDALARASLSFVAGSGAYNSTTGVITIPTNTSQLTNGAGYITGITSGMVTSALGYTPVTNARQLTINGTTYDLSADRSWTIPGTISGLTTNYVPKATGATGIGNSIIYDDGTSIGINNISPQSFASGGVRTIDGKGSSGFGYIAQGALTQVRLLADDSLGGLINVIGSYPLAFFVNSIERMRLTSSGNLLVGTTTDSGYRLDVNGSGRFSSSVSGTIFYSTGATSVNSGLSIEPSGWNGAKHRLSVPISGNTSMWSWNWNGSVRDYVSYGSSNIQLTDNVITFNNGSSNPSEVARFNGTNLLVGTTTDAGYKLDVNGAGRFSGSLNTTGGTRSISMQSYAADWNYMRSNGSPLVFGTQDAYNLYIRTNDVDRLTISSTGAATFSSSVTAGSNIILPSGFELVYGTGRVSILGNSTSNFLDFRTNNSTKLYINSSGNVGIGTTSPTGLLHLYASDPAFRIQSSTTGNMQMGQWDGTYNRIQGSGRDFLLINTDATNMLFSTNSTERMRITSGGNVLIGTTTDSGYKLDVVGQVRFGSALTTLGDIFITGASKAIVFNSSVSFATQIYESSGALNFNTGSATRLTLASTGAATFSSSVSATQFKTPGFVEPTSVKGLFNNTNYSGPGWNNSSLVTGNGATGVMMGGDAGLYAYGWIQGVQTDTGGVKGLYLNPLGGGVTVGGATTFNSTVTATAFYESSSVAYKNILATNPMTALNVDVIKYTRKNVDTDDVRYGYSAEQISSLMPELTNKDVTAVKYLDVHTLLIAELQREIKELKAKLN